MLLTHLTRQPERLSHEEIRRAHRRAVAALQEHERHTPRISQHLRPMR
jgi:hypothetical protein